MSPVSASPPESCGVTPPRAPARLFIDAPHLFHGLPASHVVRHDPVPVRILPVPASCRPPRSALNIQTVIQPLLLFPRKEVIQPHLPIRLPCYDFTPVIRPAFGCSSLSVGSQTSGISDSHGVTGGVYKTRERIHRGILIRDY